MKTVKAISLIIAGMLCKATAMATTTDTTSTSDMSTTMDSLGASSTDGTSDNTDDSSTTDSGSSLSLLDDVGIGVGAAAVVATAIAVPTAIAVAANNTAAPTDYVDFRTLETFDMKGSPYTSNSPPADVTESGNIAQASATDGTGDATNAFTDAAAKAVTTDAEEIFE